MPAVHNTLCDTGLGYVPSGARPEEAGGRDRHPTMTSALPFRKAYWSAAVLSFGRLLGPCESRGPLGVSYWHGVCRRLNAGPDPLSVCTYRVAPAAAP